MESRESQRNKRIAEVLRGTKSPGADALRAREELSGIEAERSQNLEIQKATLGARQAQLNTMRQAAMVAAAGMNNGAPATGPRVAPAVTAGGVLEKYGIRPGRPSVSSTSTQTVSGPNIRTTNTTNNTTRNEIHIVQPQIPLRQQPDPRATAGGAGGMNQFKAWLDSTFAKQATDYEIQQKEYRKREWNLARNSGKLFQKLTESTKSLGERMDPKNLGGSIGGQLKTLLMIFLGTTIAQWWRPLMKTIANFEAGFRAVFGLPVSGELRAGGAEGYSFVSKIKSFIGIEDGPGNKSLLGGIREVFTDGIDRLIDTLKLFVEDRRIALQKVSLPDFKTPDVNIGGFAGEVVGAFGGILKGVMAPGIQYLGDILAALMGGQAGIARKASTNLESVSRTGMKRKFGGQYFTSESTDWAGNLKADSTYGMSRIMMGDIQSRGLHTGSLMTGLGMLDRAAGRDGGVVVAPQFLDQLGFGPRAVYNLIQSGKASYVPMKLVKVPKSSAENREYNGGTLVGYAAEGAADWLNPFSGWEDATASVGGLAAKGLTKFGAKTAGKVVAGATGPYAWAALGAVGAGEGVMNYMNASAGNSGYVMKAVPMSDKRPGMPVQLIRISKDGFGELKRMAGVQSFSTSDRGFQSWVENMERNAKVAMGIRGPLRQENARSLTALRGATDAAALVDASYRKIWSRPGPARDAAVGAARGVSSGLGWAATKIDLLASGASGNPGYSRSATMQNLYVSLKNAIDKKRPDLAPDKREAFARLMTAQAMHESGGGQSKLAREANNYGGVIAIKGRPSYSCVDNSTKRMAQWAKFDSVQDWADFHVDLIGGSRYNTFDGDPTDYVHSLKTGGYFEADEGAYAKSVQKFVGQVNGVVGAGNYTSFTATGGVGTGSPWMGGAISLGRDLSGNAPKGMSPDAVQNEALRKVLAARNTGKFFSTTLGTTTLGRDNYRGQCTAGPSTWYAAAGIHIRGNGVWWNGATPERATTTGLEKHGFVKIWNGSIEQLGSFGNDQLRPGDVAVLFGYHRGDTRRPSSHGMMWDGKYWVSDCVQVRDGARSLRPGRLGNQSAQLYRHRELWSDAGDGLSDLGNSMLASDGTVYHGSVVGAAIGAGAHKVADALRGAAGAVGSLVSDTSYRFDKNSLTGAQKATYRWMKQAGALEDETGLYLIDRRRGIRANLDINSGISRSGQLTRDNIGSIVHLGPNGSARAEGDPTMTDVYKGKLIGDNLGVKVNQGVTPGSVKVGLRLGRFRDYEGLFSKRAVDWYESRIVPGIEYILDEVSSTGSEATGVLTRKIPILRDSWWRSSDTGRSSMFDQDIQENTRTGGAWTYLYKKSGFRWTTGGKSYTSDSHPYMVTVLKIGLTPKALEIQNAFLDYLRGELEPGDSRFKEIMKGTNFGKAEKNLGSYWEGIRKHFKAAGARNIMASVLGSGSEADQAKKFGGILKDYQSGKHSGRYMTVESGRPGIKEVLDSETGLRIGTLNRGLDGKDHFRASTFEETRGLLTSRGGDYLNYNTRRISAGHGELAVDLDSMYNRYHGIHSKGLETTGVRNRFFRELAGTRGSTYTSMEGLTLHSMLQSNGKFKYVLGRGAFMNLANGETNMSNTIARIKKLYPWAVRPDGSIDTGKLSAYLDKGIGREEAIQLSLGQDIQSDLDMFDYANTETALEKLRKGGVDEGRIAKILKSAQIGAQLESEWSNNGSETRILANRIVSQFNEVEARGGKHSDNVWTSGGVLMYRDGLGQVHALGEVNRDPESGRIRATTALGGKAGAEGKDRFVGYNKALVSLNDNTIAGRAKSLAYLTARLGAKSMGNGLMYLETPDRRTRVVFSADEVGPNATVRSILRSKSTRVMSYNPTAKDTIDGGYSEGFDMFGAGGWRETGSQEKTLGSDGTLIGANLGIAGGLGGALTGAGIGRLAGKIFGGVQDAERAKVLEKLGTQIPEGRRVEAFKTAFHANFENIQADMAKRIESGTLDAAAESNEHLKKLEDFGEQSRDYLGAIAEVIVRKSGDKSAIEQLNEVNKRSAVTHSTTSMAAAREASREEADRIVKKRRIDFELARALKASGARGWTGTFGYQQAIKAASAATGGQITEEDIRAAYGNGPSQYSGRLMVIGKQQAIKDGTYNPVKGGGGRSSSSSKAEAKTKAAAREDARKTREAQKKAANKSVEVSKIQVEASNATKTASLDACQTYANIRRVLTKQENLADRQLALVAEEEKKVFGKEQPGPGGNILNDNRTQTNNINIHNHGTPGAPTPANGGGGQWWMK